MTSGTNRTSWIWLILLCLHVVDCSLVTDLVNNLASSGADCMILVSELNAEATEADFWIDTNNVSRISVAQYDINASHPHLSTMGKYCLYNLLIFDNVDSSLQFFNR